MSRKKISQNNQQAKPARKRRGSSNASAPKFSLPLRYRLLMFACGATLVAGFFFAARTHFASIDFSMRNSRLKKMSDELEADKRRLLLAKEIALSPAELKKAAQKIVFTANKPETARASAAAAKTGKTEKPRGEVSTTTAKLKQAIVEKADDFVAEAKATLKKSIEVKAPDLRARRETVQTER
jgi:hypothetical protein